MHDTGIHEIIKGNDLMNKFFSLLCVIFILSGCWLSLNFSQEIQDKWRGQPIGNIIDRLGPFQTAQNKKGEIYIYIGNDHFKKVHLQDMH